MQPLLTRPVRCFHHCWRFTTGCLGEDDPKVFFLQRLRYGIWIRHLDLFQFVTICEMSSWNFERNWWFWIYIYIYGTPPKKPTFSHFVPVFTVVFCIFEDLFFKAFFLMVLEVVFINVYKHRGSWIQDPRSKILGKTSWIQGLDPRSKTQDSRKNFLDPRSGSKIQDPRFWAKLLGSKVWIQDPRSKILGKTS